MKAKYIKVIKYILFVAMVMILPLSLVFRMIFFHEEDTKRSEVLWEKRREKAKLPLKKFNEQIFINIAFSGVIIKDSYSRQEIGCEPRGSYWFEVKLDEPIILCNSVPSKIPFIYDFTVNPVKIYYILSKTEYAQTLTYSQQNKRIEKKIGEIFIRIYPNDTGNFYKIHYSPYLRYFWQTDNKSELKNKKAF